MPWTCTCGSKMRTTNVRKKPDGSMWRRHTCEREECRRRVSTIQYEKDFGGRGRKGISRPFPGRRQ